MNALRRLLSFSLAALCLPAALYANTPEEKEGADAVASTIPRFVSFRSEEVNLRTGPGTRYPIKWVYRKEGLPVEVVEEFEHWRKVKLPDGEDGWVFKGMLSGKRNVQIKAEVETVYQRPELNAPKVMRLEKGVVAELKICQEDWCQVSIAGAEGWIKKTSLYGVYANKESY
jgi:SH3-like domain-containing protein